MTQKRGLNSTGTRWLMIVAQVLALIAMLLALQFLWNTTGGTLFAFTAAAPVLALVSVAIVAGVGIHMFRKRHSLFEIQAFQAGEEILREGERGDCAYFIRSGEVEVTHDRDGNRVLLGRLGPGQYFGEMALLSNAPRSATVRAVTPVSVALLGKSNFLTMLSVVPFTQEDVLKTMQERAMRQKAG